MTLDLPESFQFGGRSLDLTWEFSKGTWTVGFHPYPDPKEGAGELLGFGPTPILAALDLLAGYHRLRDFRDDDPSRWPGPTAPVDRTACGLMYGNHTFATWTSLEGAVEALGDPTNPVHRKCLEVEVAFIHRQGARSLDLYPVRFEAMGSFLPRAREWFQAHSVGANNPKGVSDG